MITENVDLEMPALIEQSTTLRYTDLRWRW